MFCWWMNHRAAHRGVLATARIRVATTSRPDVVGRALSATAWLPARPASPRREFVFGQWLGGGVVGVLPNKALPIWRLWRLFPSTLGLF
jgi:hypothetical protein